MQERACPNDPKGERVTCWGAILIIRTDHKSLKYLEEKRLLDGEQQKVGGKVVGI